MEINAILGKKLIAAQFPQWENLSITAVEKSGWDNRTFHLGKDMTIRIPSDEEYAPQILKEYQWLPKLAKGITTCQITTPMALGQPCEFYPWHWSINHWIEGETASIESIRDLNQFARELALFLTEFQSIESTDGPAAGIHNFYRGGDLSVYNDDLRLAIPKITNINEQEIAEQLWAKALSSRWEKNPIWVHGDIAVGNILVKKGKLAAVIDFGQLAIGDPACDLAIAWNFFTGESRKIFKESISVDKNTWIRALGWAFWKTLCWPVKGTDVKRILSDIYQEYRTLYC
ncbi:TPA: aminoglycoside phosphotransferase family protein [Legionella pneumophila]|nr:aminoglycoside phosphotransferase family protein [Legionella pneumophila]HBD7410354.1 aminoglycoside phosphotransferase family protein [Legionella pneumophila]HBD9405547.1 aminoglycoside phosphotransferase family protein [Legionella pneumophila]HBI2968776.1 aminoglycoside phosphotransferase family protein [Legionella pneumophila]